MRSLRAQRLAVEQLKQKARQDERTSEVLRRKLIEAAEKIEELRAQGGRDVVRRLMDEVSGGGGGGVVIYVCVFVVNCSHFPWTSSFDFFVYGFVVMAFVCCAILIVPLLRVLQCDREALVVLALTTTP